MLAPKKLKRRKHHRPTPQAMAFRANSLAFGRYGIQATTGGWVKAQQIEAARRVITRFIKRGGKFWIRIFPHRPITQKGSQSTMGGGKGVPEFYVAAVAPGTILFELDGIAETEAKEAMRLAGHKLPVRTKFVIKE